MSAATLDEIGSDAAHVYHLLDVMMDMVLDNALAPGGQGEWPRLSALLWVARDLAKKVDTDIEALPRGAAANGGAA